MSYKTDTFEKEIGYVKDEKIREFLTESIEAIPDYFFKMGASSTGKYHPKYAQGEGGLLRHTKAAVIIAMELFGMNDLFTEEERNLIIASLILHDGWKKGTIEEKYTREDHPVVATNVLNVRFSEGKNITTEQLGLICDNIVSHMGRWNTKRETGEELFPQPKGKMERFVHMCDYLASRKTIEINFDAEISNR